VNGWVMAVTPELGATAKWNLDMMQGRVHMSCVKKR